MATNKTYVGKGWIKTFENGGSVVNLKLKLADLQKLPQNKYGEVSVTVAGRREVDEKSKATHTVYAREIAGEEPF